MKMQKSVILVKEKFENKYLKEYRGGAHEICNLKDSGAVLQLFIMYLIMINILSLKSQQKNLTNTLLVQGKKRWNTCNLYITNRKKKLQELTKNGDEIINKTSYILQFIDSARFLASLLSNILNNISKGIHKIKCKYGYVDKKCKTCRSNTKILKL